jgi:hypothetical protein
MRMIRNDTSIDARMKTAQRDVQTDPPDCLTRLAVEPAERVPATHDGQSLQSPRKVGLRIESQRIFGDFGREVRKGPRAKDVSTDGLELGRSTDPGAEMK